MKEQTEVKKEYTQVSLQMPSKLLAELDRRLTAERKKNSGAPFKFTRSSLACWFMAQGMEKGDRQ